MLVEVPELLRVCLSFVESGASFEEALLSISGIFTSAEANATRPMQCPRSTHVSILCDFSKFFLRIRIPTAARIGTTAGQCLPVRFPVCC